MFRARASLIVVILTGALVGMMLSCGRGILDFPGGATATGEDGSGSGTGTGSRKDGDGDDDGSTDDLDGAAEPTPASCAAAGKELCAGTCVKLTSDPLHCGACDRHCDGITPVCNLGVCSPSCTGGLKTCAGACLDLRSDPENCGDCSVVCNGGCTRGECVCAPNQKLCGRTCVDTTSDRNNCGVCGKGCPESAICSGGTCI